MIETIDDKMIIKANIRKHMREYREYSKDMDLPLPMIWELGHWYESEGKPIRSLLPKADADFGEGLMGLDKSIIDDSQLKKFEIPDECTIYSHKDDNFAINIYKLETRNIIPVYFESINLNGNDWSEQDILLHYEKNGSNVWFSRYGLFRHATDSNFEPFEKKVKIAALNETSRLVEISSKENLPYKSAYKKMADFLYNQITKGGTK